jgi:diguanylate cyclase (GGDEF)-like protein
MISLKHHMELQREEVLASTIASFRDLVASIAGSAARVCPALASTFQHSLMQLRERFSSSAQACAVAEAGLLIRKEVDAWGVSAGQYYRRKTEEIREILLAMTDAAKAAGARDLQYRDRFNEVSARLAKVADLEDLTQIRSLVSRTANDLINCANRMVEEGQQSVAGLRMQIRAYEERLAEAERISETDPLTGLANRVGFEHALDARIRAGRPFSLLIADLNEFKDINDLFGHLAGDELLKGFASEFRAQFRSFDFVSRWGGDEFAALLDAEPAQIENRINYIRNWASGDYLVRVAGKSRKIRISAAVGVVAWQPGMSAEELFARADQAMYSDKTQSKRLTA